MTLYNDGFVVGRFQMLHNGHVQMIRTALELCDRVIVCVGSSQESNTVKNPFSFIEREHMLILVFNHEVETGKLVIIPLPDTGVGNNEIWGAYVLDTIISKTAKCPDLYVSGCEKERGSWFSDNIAPYLDELRLSRHVCDISASKCRDLLFADNYSEWCKNIPNELYNNYEFYKERIQKLIREN